MSSSLRERLKRSSRYYSPQGAKRICSNEEETQDNSSIDNSSLKAPNIACQTNEDSSQDFEYSDSDERDQVESNVTHQPHSAIPLNFENDENVTKTSSVRDHSTPLCRDRILVPKFQKQKTTKILQDDLAQSANNTCTVIPEKGVDSDKCTSKDEQVEDCVKKQTSVPKFRRKILSKPCVSSEASSLECDKVDKKTKNTTASEPSKYTAVSQDIADEESDTEAQLDLSEMCQDELKSEKQSLLAKLEKKEETLRKLKMVKMYRSKVRISILSNLYSSVFR